MFTFEINNECDEIELHLDKEGIKKMREVLDLIEKNQSHEHLFTPSWGGNELSEEVQNERNKLLNKVTFFFWK